MFKCFVRTYSEAKLDGATLTENGKFKDYDKTDYNLLKSKHNNLVSMMVDLTVNKIYKRILCSPSF